MRRPRRRRRPYDLTSTWNRVKAQVLARDNYTCQLRLEGCQITAVTADHIVPWGRQGGAWFDLSNLRASCGHCNRAREDQSRKQRPRKASREW
jgi:5-methylcytosine-specific restriction endonuclease McrA